MVNEALSSNSLDSTRKSWEMFIGDKRHHFVAEHGTRFGIKGKNASIIVSLRDKLIEFSKSHVTNAKLQQLLVLLQDDAVFDELVCLAAVWSICLEPLWSKLRCANVVDSIELLKSFVQLADDAQNLDPRAMITDPTKNRAIRSIRGLGAIETKVFDLLATHEPRDALAFDCLLRKMLESAAAYVRCLQKNWDVEHIPSCLLKIKFSNQVICVIFCYIFYL